MILKVNAGNCESGAAKKPALSSLPAALHGTPHSSTFKRCCFSGQNAAKTCPNSAFYGSKMRPFQPKSARKHSPGDSAGLRFSLLLPLRLQQRR